MVSVLLSAKGSDKCSVASEKLGLLAARSLRPVEAQAVEPGCDWRLGDRQT